MKDKIKAKFASLKDIIIERINKKDDISVSNFQFEFITESIQPVLTALNGYQILAAVGKLKKNPTLYSLDTKDEIDKITKIELYKVKTNLSYSYNFGSGKNYQDDYNDAELLLTENINDYAKIKRYTQETVTDIFTKADEVKNVSIYYNPDDDQERTEIQKYEYIGKQMDWDFSKQVVKDEIKSMQYDNINNLKKDGSSSPIKDVISEMKFDKDKFEFEIYSSMYMKFDNAALNLKRYEKNCILVCGATVIESSEGIKKITDQFFADNDWAVNKWNGGKINHDFIEQVKQEVEKENPRITLSDYYGLAGTYNEYDDMLIGYGTTTVKRASYAGLSFADMTIDTNLISPSFGTGMAHLYDDFKQYIETFLSAIRNEKATGEGKNKGLIKRKASEDSTFFLQWGFGNNGEWDIIKNGIKKFKDVKLSFDWIMENVLLEKRIYGNSEYILPENKGVLDPAKTSVKSVKEIKYAQSENGNKYLVADLKDLTVEDFSAKMYIKYGPFTAYLNDNDTLAIWYEENSGITPKWEAVD